MVTAEELLFSERFLWEGKYYLVHVYRHAVRRERGLHMAETILGPGDTIISDGRSPEEALHKQQSVLPLAILSRSLLNRAASRHDNRGHGGSLAEWHAHGEN